MQHVEDEALFDGLLHRVEVERLGRAQSALFLVPNNSNVLAFGVAVKAKKDRFFDSALAAISATSTSSAELPAVAEIVDLRGAQGALSFLEASPAWEEWASSATMAKLLPASAASVWMTSRAKGKVWMVTMMIFVPLPSASASS